MSFKGGLMTTGTGISLQVVGKFATALVVLVALGTCLSVAQTSTATILGTVKDTSGALVPGVSITVKHTERGLTRSVVSGERGAYTVPLLPVGAYEITTTMRRPVLPTVPMEARSLTRIRRIRSGNTLASRALTTSFPARIRSRQTSPLTKA